MGFRAKKANTDLLSVSFLVKNLVSMLLLSIF